ncbi:uncharacterized protein Hap1MRO34_006879 isoform 2-T3 [Clarias gariepinus]
MIQEMQEQVGKLTALLQDERRSHQQSYRALLKEAEQRTEKCRKHHQLEMEELMQDHRSEISKLVAAHTKALEDERNTAEEKFALLKKDYDFLKCSIRPQKDNVFDEYNCSKNKEEQERCMKKQLLWLKEQLNQSETERQKEERQKKAFQSEIAELQVNFEVEVGMCHLSELGKGL